MESKAESQAEQTYLDNKNSLKISEREINNLFPVKDSEKFSFIDDGDTVNDLIIHGRSVFKKENDSKNYKYHSDTVEKMKIASLGEDEATQNGKYVVNLDVNMNNINKSVQILLDEPLRDIYGTCDTIDLLKKTVTKRIAQQVISGNNEITIKTKGDKYTSFYVPLSVEAKNTDTEIGNVLCDHLRSLIDSDSIINSKDSGITLSNDGKNVIISLPNNLFPNIDVDNIKKYLNDNNITILYPRKDAVLEKLNFEDIDFYLKSNSKLSIKLNNDLESLIDLYLNTNKENAVRVNKILRNPSWNGKLKVIDGDLCNQFNTPIQLRGCSTFNIAQKTNKSSYNGLKTTKLYGANYIRVAMYLNNGRDGSKGYLEDKENMKKKVENIIKWASDLDMYVCVDWHGLANNKPLDNIDLSKEFFNEITEEFKNYPNVIYEIFNEPPKDNGTWENQIVPYSNEIIPLIRNINPDALIIVGTQSTDNIWEPTIKNPLKYDNIVYSYHTYGGYFNNAYKYMCSNLPMFLSEWGVGDASSETQDSANYNTSQSLLKYTGKFNISWAMWSLSDKEGCHNFVAPGNEKDGGWIGDELSTTGKFIIDYFNNDNFYDYRCVDET